MLDSKQKPLDGSYDIHFAPQPPNGQESNWLPTVPGKSWFVAQGEAMHARRGLISASRF
ncbi:MAG: DUF1214 domain-containing protein [Desulfobacterales bacterium]|nr:MAG: DUF1214 domain-containing protein [Desulfobacterales bacterium]